MERRLAAAPAEAYDAWLQFVWRQGGGLGALCLADGAAKGEARTMYPVGMREELTQLQRGRRVEYRVTDFGLFFGLGDHSGVVDFVPDGEASKLTWSVRFSSPGPLCGFWEAVTNFLVGTAAANLEEVLRQEPMRITVEETLDRPPLEALAAFESFTWRAGGGFPFLPPQILEGAASGEGLTRVILPPGLQERFTRVARSDKSCSVEYVVDNPGFLTLYPVAAHAGRVQLDAVGSGTRLVWTVEALPLPGCAGFVETFTRLVVETLAANLRRELQR